MNIENLIKILQELGKKVKPSLYFRVSSKERVLSLIESKTHRKQPIYNWKKWTSGIAIISLLFLISIPFPNLLKTPLSSYIAQAKVLEGEMTIFDGKEEKTVSSNTEIHVGDELTTSDNSRIEINFIDNSKSLLFKETKLIVENVFVNPEDVKNSLVFLKLEQGEMLSTVSKSTEDELSNFQIETPSGIIEAKKSNFSVKVLENGETEVTPLTNSVDIQVKDQNSNNKTILAKATATEGYTVKTSSTKESPLEIEITEEKEENINDKSNDIISHTLPEDTVMQSTVLGNLDIAKVHLLRCITALNSNNDELALKSCQEYRSKVRGAHNSLTYTDTSEKFSDTDISNILANSLLPKMKKSLEFLEESTFKESLSKNIESLNILEVSAKEKIVMESLEVFEQEEEEKNENTNSLNSNTNSESNRIKIRTSQSKLDGKIAFEVKTIKDLVDLKESVSEEKQKEINKLISSSIHIVASYINSIADWQEQRQRMTEIVNLIPNDIIYKEALLELRSKVSDRIDYIVSKKLAELQ